MCRNIQRLYNIAPPATEAEVRAAATQYVRKVTGMGKPSAANAEAVQQAIDDIAAITLRLLQDELSTLAAPRAREKEAEAAKKRGQNREDRLRQKILASFSAE